VIESPAFLGADNKGCMVACDHKESCEAAKATHTAPVAVKAAAEAGEDLPARMAEVSLREVQEETRAHSEVDGLDRSKSGRDA
jgi:hypothetical protein